MFRWIVGEFCVVWICYEIDLDIVCFVEGWFKCFDVCRVESLGF